MTKKKGVVQPTKEELLERLKKFKQSNKVRREKLANDLGFANAAIYMQNLEALIANFGVVSTVKVEVKPKEEIVVPKEEKESLQPIDMVFAFDTTGSMRSYIENVKKHVQTVIPDLLKNIPNLKIKIVAFGDYCDMTSATFFGNAYQESEFTDDCNKLISFIRSAKNTSGGDGDEFYELVVKKVVEETPWRSGSKRTFTLIGDCEPHGVGYSYTNIVKNAQIDWKIEAKNAKKLDIKIDTLSIIPNYAKFYQQLSEITGGVHMPFKSSNKMNEVFTANAYATAASRGDVFAKERFKSMTAIASLSKDDELIGTYKSLKTKF